MNYTAPKLKTIIKSDSPGPNLYKIEDKSMRKTCPAWGMGHASRSNGKLL